MTLGRTQRDKAERRTMNIGDPTPSPSEEGVVALDAMLKELVFGL